MERLLRLRRNAGKDYSHIVEFPVEILGRDGNIRRLSFGESLRLYQRRIRSAPLRYESHEEIEAEIFHCRQRIDQLRRSYMEHFAWGPFRGQLQGTLGTVLAADVVFFLRRMFDENPDLLAGIHIRQLESGLCDICFVQSGSMVYLLHVWRQDRMGRDGSRIRAHRDTVRKRFADVPAIDGVERILCQWDAGDVLVVVTGMVEPLLVPVFEDDPPAPTGDAWVDGMRALHDGYVGVALDRLERGLDQSPGRKLLVQATTLVALMDGQAERAGFNARFGLLYHPTDTTLVYLRALSCFQLGQLSEARTLVGEIKDDPKGRLLWCVDDLQRGNLFGAIQSFIKLKRMKSDMRMVMQGQIALQEWFFQTVLLMVLAALILLLPSQGLLTSLSASSLAFATLVVAIASLMMQARRAFSLVGHPQIRMVSGDLLPRERRADLH